MFYSLLAFKVIGEEEATLRGSKYYRSHMKRQLKYYPSALRSNLNNNSNSSNLKEAKKMYTTLIKSLRVDEEVSSGSLRTVTR